MSKSKLNDLNYTELKMQEYLTLKTMNVTEAKSMFKFRVRMAPFGENYKGGQTLVLCPLCKKHPDNQEESFKCEEIKNVLEVKGCYKEIFGTTFPSELVNTVNRICNYREEHRKLIEK